MKKVIKIAEFKYPKSDTGDMFGYSTTVVAMAEDTLDVFKMNVNPSGKQ